MRHILQWSLILKRYSFMYELYSMTLEMTDVWAQVMFVMGVHVGLTCWTLLDLENCISHTGAKLEDFPEQQTWGEARLHPISCVPVPWPDHISAVSERVLHLSYLLTHFPHIKWVKTDCLLVLFSNTASPQPLSEQFTSLFCLSGFYVVQHNKDSSSVFFL